MHRRWLKLCGALVATSAAAFSAASDHGDSPSALADPAADIGDMYSWMDGGRFVMVMNIFPGAPAGAKFSDQVQYWFHTQSGQTLGDAASTLDAVCTFDISQNIQCWAGDEYVSGDASNTKGLKSESGKLKVFAGLRDDPFFFNIDGFSDSIKLISEFLGMQNPDAAGCPSVDQATSGITLSKLTKDGMNGPAKDGFAGKNVLSIVLSLDKSMVNTGGPMVSVWGATRKNTKAN